MRTFSLFTLGCKVNAYESEFYRQSLIESGYVEVLPKEPADIVIINTCTVTNTASFKSRQRIHQAKRTNPDAFVVVVGCYAQTHHEELKAKYDIDLLIGAKHKNELVTLIQEKLGTSDFSTPKSFEALPIHSFTHQKKAYVKIQDGCNQFCSYCIIPFARGRERSLAPDEVLKQIQALGHHQEIVLTGIHTGRYGLDVGSSLTELIRRILKETNIQRIRISSIEITEISEELIELMAREPRLARHLHIPLQAGDDRILKAMNRPYTLDQYRRQLSELKRRIPGLNVSADVIVGFPGETQAEFEDSLVAIEAMGFAFLHVFPYSKRAFTKAADLPEQLSEALKKDRVHAMQSLSDRLFSTCLESRMGTALTVLIEERQDQGLFGYSGDYLPVLLDGPDTLINQLVPCTVKATRNGFLIAETPTL